MTTAAEILRAAKAKLTPETWRQHCPSQPRRDYCAGEAIAYAIIDLPNRAFDAVDYTADAAYLFRRANGIEGGGIMQWNDQLGRTLEQVHEAFDKAIDLAEAVDEDIRYTLTDRICRVVVARHRDPELKTRLDANPPFLEVSPEEWAAYAGAAVEERAVTDPKELQFAGVPLKIV